MRKKTILSIAISFLLIITTLTLAFSYMFLFNTQSVKGTATQTVGHNVVYKPNTSFTQNKIQDNIKGSYLLSYTDYIQVNDSLNLNLDKAMDVTYSYNAYQNLIINYDSGNSTTPTQVLNVVYPLKTVTQTANGKDFSFKPNHGAEPGGSYSIDPYQFIKTYNSFLQEESKMIKNRNLIFSRSPSFSAQLVLTFEYTFVNAKNNLNKTLSRTVTIPLTNEVYSVTYSGAPTIALDEGAKTSRSLPLGATFLMCIIIASATCVIIVGVKSLKRKGGKSTKKENKYNEDKMIERHYGRNIVKLQSMPDARKVIQVKVTSFDELLKIAISGDKAINSYFSDDGTIIYLVFSDGFMYRYQKIQDADY
ncbi:MAG: DUF5305 domain-containing protein [Clostridiales bacterium]|jgi:hypothetical protein|nr:DUF5305 domain-containing protein [Clostridiales bacterium]